MTPTATSETATLDQDVADLHPLLAQRWSPRSYDPSGEVSDAELAALLEAARWAPSASNLQPRRFLVHRRGSHRFDVIVQHLAQGNQRWAADAAVLIVGVAEVADPEGADRRWAHYDLGQSVAHLTVQAQAQGLAVRQMGGFDGPGLARAFGVPDRFEILNVTAVGRSAVTEPAAARERLPLEDLVNPDWE